MSFLTKIIYTILFILLLIHPHFITGHVFSIPRAFAQSIITLILFIIAFVVYVSHKRAIKKKEEVELDLLNSSSKLVEAYEYIGTVNRRLPLLNKVTTGVLKKSKQSKKSRKKVFEDLLAMATVSLAHASWGVFRFVEISHSRTIREFEHLTNDLKDVDVKIDNKTLLAIALSGQSHQVLQIDNLCILPTSDTKSPIQCFFIFPQGEVNINVEFSTLQAVIDQVQLLYQYVYTKDTN